MDMSVFTFIFFSCALIVGVWCQSCEESHYERCLKQLLKFSNRGDLMFASSAAELETECVQAQSALGCLTRYSKKCLPLEERSNFSESISGPQKITKGLCSDESDLGARYIKNLPCFKNISEGIQYCRVKYERNQRDIILVEYEDKVHLQCCSFDGYRRCLKILTLAQTDCTTDEEVSDVMDEIVVRMGGSLSAGACADHVERCTGSGSQRTDPNLVLMSWLWALGAVLFVRRW